MRKQHLLIVAMAAALMASCAREPIFETAPAADPDLIPLNIDGSISQVATKATAQGFVDGDAVGLYAVNYSENNTVAGTLAVEGNQADNVKYTFNESAHKWVPAKNVYYKDVNTHVDLYLYYPYQENINDVSEGGFEVKKDQSAAATATSLSGYEASDFLWGKATDITPVESAVAIRLSHKLSAVQVILTEGTGFAQDEFEALSKSVIVTNTTRKATINYSTGVATALGEPQLDGIVMCPQIDGSFRAIVIPQTVGAGEKLFSITIDGIAYGFKQSAAVEYQAGKQLQVTININKKSHTGDYELELANSQIIDWTEDLNTHGGEARQYYVVNVETPGTLGDVIASAGKNPDKIRNLKVTGTVTTEDFYFMRDHMAILEAVNMKECKVRDALLDYSGYYGEVYSYPDHDNDIFESTIMDDAIPSDAFRDKSSLYFFVFPESVKKIGSRAFYGSSLSGPLTLPSDLEEIRNEAFRGTNITHISFNDRLVTIGGGSFLYCNSLTGELLLPMSLRAIMMEAFARTGHLTGPLALPPLLETIGGGAFTESGTFSGDLSFPDGITQIGYGAFNNSVFSGSLFLNNVKDISEGAFQGCHFSGTLVLNPDITHISGGAFNGNSFTDLKLPENVKMIGEWAFAGNPFMNSLIIPEGCTIIKGGAFYGCSFIPEIVFPSTLLTIGNDAFANCFGVTKMTSMAKEPPYVFGGTFNGVGKDNLTLEVPPESITRYATTDGWGDFKRISAHYDFSINRRLYRTLNASVSRQFVIRAPSGMDWSIENKPDWVTVSPDHGTGNATLTITVEEMPRSSETFESEIWKNGSYQDSKTYKGRAGEVVFLLNEKDYHSTLNVEQYDYEYSDGQVLQPLSHTRGGGIDLVFLGDGYDARDIAEGAYLQNMQTAIEHFFAIEPYATYKDYFNAHIVFARSEESGLETVNTINENKFGSYLPIRLAIKRPDSVFAYTRKAPIGDLNRSLAILLVNSSIYEGVTYLYEDGSAIAVCPVSEVAYPYDFRGIVQHEAGGHGFGKLGDEYVYHHGYINMCPQCGCLYYESFKHYKAIGWFRNMELTGDWNKVGWSHLIFHPSYSDMVDVYEGGYMHSRSVWRSETTSCMNNNIPYYSAISRQAIVERIKEYSGETFTLEDFYANDSFAIGTKAANPKFDRTFGVNPSFHLGSGEDVVYMGEHPNVK